MYPLLPLNQLRTLEHICGCRLCHRSKTQQTALMLCPVWETYFYELSCSDWRWFTYLQRSKTCQSVFDGRSVVGVCVRCGSCGCRCVCACELLPSAAHLPGSWHLQPPPHQSQQTHHVLKLEKWLPSWQGDIQRVTKLCSEPLMKLLAGYNYLAVV